MSVEPQEPHEEEFDGHGTGVEIEQNDQAPGLTEPVKPWDPDQIRVSTKNFSLRNVLDMIDNEDLDLAPDFQRNRVWKERQKSRLIESLLLQIPLPAFYFAEDPDGTLRVVDGLQRLSTIHSFVREQSFRLTDLEYLDAEIKKHFSELGPALQRRLNNAQIVVHVIDPSTPTDVKYDIFKRINTGGEPLNAMEIRHCMSKPRSRSFLKSLTTSKNMHEATGGVLLNHIRMNDRESALRFVAFHLLPSISAYDQIGSLEGLLDLTVERLDDPATTPDNLLQSTAKTFELAMKNSFDVFGEHAFRKWPVGSNRLSPINRALFESWSVVLGRYSEDLIHKYREDIRKEARRAMTANYAYIDSISSSTADPRRVQLRFQVANDIVENTVK